MAGSCYCSDGNCKWNIFWNTVAGSTSALGRKNASDDAGFAAVIQFGFDYRRRTDYFRYVPESG